MKGNPCSALRGEAHGPKAGHRLCLWHTWHTCRVSCVTCATTAPGLCSLLRAGTKPWAALCSHLSCPLLPCPVFHTPSGGSCAVAMVILCHIHHHRVTEVSSVLTASQKKGKTTFNRLSPVTCYIKNGITLQSSILGIYHCTTTQIPGTAPGCFDLEPTKTNTTFSRS